ncbi:MAG: alpha/beta fold hydrolase [Thermodesulfobacteriota bacterium]
MKTRASNQYRRLYPYRSNYLNLNGFKYHYLDQGRGRPVIMIHGNPTWSFYYRSLIAGLSSDFRTIAPDHIGCGLSDKPTPSRYGYRLRDRVKDLTAFLESLGLKERMTLVVHDWGGPIGLSYAVAHAERIAGLVVLNTAAFLPPAHKRLPLRLRIVRDLKRLAVPAVLGLNLFLLGTLLLGARRRISGPVKTGYLAPYDSWENRVAILRFVQDIPLRPGNPNYQEVKDLSDHLERLENIPLLICWGLRDFVFDRDYLAEWRRRFPRAEVHEYPEAGHLVLEDEPGEVLTRVRAFLEQKALF